MRGTRMLKPRSLQRFTWNLEYKSAKMYETRRWLRIESPASGRSYVLVIKASSQVSGELEQSHPADVTLTTGRFAVFPRARLNVQPQRSRRCSCSGSSSSEMQTFLRGRRVGYWLSEKKMKKLNFQAFADLCRYVVVVVVVVATSFINPNPGMFLWAGR